MKKLILILSCIFFVIPCQARIIYVDANTPDNNDGSEWSKAYQYLQDALADANTSGDVNEIWVAQGIYKPDSNSADPNGSGDREATFQLINEVALRGGYAGFDEPDSNSRDIELYETILSGDLDGNDVGVDVEDLSTEPTRSENSYHVIVNIDNNSTPILDGFTITGGNANGLEVNDRGGGIYGYTSDIIITNCTIIKNSASDVISGSQSNIGGGGISFSNGDATIIDCVISENLAKYDYLASNPAGGGGIHVVNGSITLNKCVINDNRAELLGSSNDGGGGLHLRNATSHLEDSIFNDNQATSGRGDAVFVLNNNPYLSLTAHGCSFIGNSARNGRGIYLNWSDSCFLENCIFIATGFANFHNPIGLTNISNCTFIGTRVENKPHLVFPGTISIINSILWDTTITQGSSGTLNIEYSNIQGGESSITVLEGGTLNWLEGNIDTDPCFADPCNSDYHLKSQAGRWDSNSQSWVQDANTSPCIDTGDPNSPIGLEPFPNGGRINMGAYGSTIEASKSYFGGPICETIVAGDINGDCVVDGKDLAIMALHWLEDNNP